MILAPTTGQHIACPPPSTVMCSVLFRFHGLKLMRNRVAIFRRVSELARNDYELRNVCPSVRLEQLGSTGRILKKSDFLVFLKNLPLKFKFH
jgi:hypothetical protein